MPEIKRSNNKTYNAYMGLQIKGDRLLHWEHWSNPDAETYLSRIDYYEHPRLCRLKLNELYPHVNCWAVPATDEPKPRPIFGKEISADNKNHTVRWGDGETGTFEHGSLFKTAEDVFDFSPLERADFSKWAGSVVENGDFTSEEAIYQRYRNYFPKEWGDTAPEGSSAQVGFYNTMFMWPLLTFGWDLFLECCLDEKFERIMDEFAEINRRVFKAFARLPINFVICHDDIVTTRGPVCSPQWMNKYIFPRYEEFWGYLKAAGKNVIFMVDGCVDRHADNIMVCGARGIISEPYTDYKAIAKKHKNCFIAGEGDNRILNRNNPAEIRTMVESMADTAKMTGGYMMCIGNHIPWNVNPEGIKRYFDLCGEMGILL